MPFFVSRLRCDSVGSRALGIGHTTGAVLFASKLGWQIVVCATTLLTSLVYLQPSRAIAQDSSTRTDWRAERASVEQEFGEELQEIANWCRAVDLETQVEPTFALYNVRDLMRQYVFMPTNKSMPTPGEGPLGQWQSKINAAQRAHAERIFDLARQAAEADSGAVAYQLLFEVIHHDHDHETARLILGHVRDEQAGGWKVAPESVKVRSVARTHDVLPWKSTDFIRVQTPNFQIDSNAGEERTRFLAEKLERWHLVWRQVFFEYWSSRKTIARCLAGNKRVTQGRRPNRYRVIFFRDKSDYVRTLQPMVKGIARSTGYYSPDLDMSFFFDGDDSAQSTWRHELTHQLFRESRLVSDTAFTDRYFWIDEGIATYFESVTDFGDYVTLGGFEAERLQFARIRKLLEGFHIGIAELSMMSRDLFQQQDLERLYSEIAGLSHMLMDGDRGMHQAAVVEFLQLGYRGKLKTGSFEKIVGATYAELEQRYQEFLRVDSETVEKFLSLPETRTELSLAGSPLQPAAYEAIGRCTNLKWLDLSRNEVRQADLEELRSCSKLQQLMLTSCRFEANTLSALTGLPALQELNLSGSSVQDSQLAALAAVPNLQALQLTNTAISDAGVESIAAIPALRLVNLAATQLTPQGLQRLRQLRPGLEISQ